MLAIAMTLVPNPEHPSAPTVKQSERVEVSVVTSDGRSTPHITLTVWNLNMNSVDSITIFSTPNFSFYQTAGRYRFDFSAPGYRVVRKELIIEDNKPVPQLAVMLPASGIPVFIQRIFPTR